jgi:hypothetical protein
MFNFQAAPSFGATRLFRSGSIFSFLKKVILEHTRFKPRLYTEKIPRIFKTTSSLCPLEPTHGTAAGDINNGPAPLFRAHVSCSCSTYSLSLLLGGGFGRVVLSYNYYR